jgi:hypothetical protein
MQLLDHLSAAGARHKSATIFVTRSPNALVPSRAAAVRELLRRGLAAEGFGEAAFGSKSSDYGVTGNTPSGRDRR